MNVAERFFRRYILSTFGILLLFFMINILLICGFFSATYTHEASDERFSIEQLSAHITKEDGRHTADDAARAMLRQKNAWAMLLDDDGDILWEMDLPENLSRKYTVTDVAVFTHWFLEDYPVRVWKHTDGLLVVGFPPNALFQYYVSLDMNYIESLMVWIPLTFLVNLLLMLYLFIRNTRRVEKGIRPILGGIQSLSKGKPFHLSETGELAEINASLNKAGAYLIKKDNTRAEWIRGISHDIRTPLSMILGYASEIEDTMDIPKIIQKQAGIIRRQGEKLKELVDNLNLTTKLEYSMQPIQKELLDPVELCRKITAEFLNDRLPWQYDLQFIQDKSQTAGQIYADRFLLERMLTNLIRNSIVHNPKGCRIYLSLQMNEDFCCFTAKDDGSGLTPGLLQALNAGKDISSIQENNRDTEHGLGLKIVRQIVLVHGGTLSFSSNSPHGLCVKIALPREMPGKE